MREFLDRKIIGKHVLILGLGAEGRSTYRLLRDLYPEQRLTLADRREDLAQETGFTHPLNYFQCGAHYLDHLRSFDLIIKSPGISLKEFPEDFDFGKLTSQTALFLEAFRSQTIGITGTKGKSTTASLIHHLLAAAGKDVLLIGNIGVPAFDVLNRINTNTLIVFELSAHQLEGIRVSPHVSILLNIFQEHLDHYADYYDYQLAKYNIARWQTNDDYFIYHHLDLHVPDLIRSIPLASKLVPYAISQHSDTKIFTEAGEVFSKISGLVENICNIPDLHSLRGNHNLLNWLAAIAACKVAGMDGIDFCSSAETFQALPHRMEFIGEFGGIRFYNDSIATIPEAVIYALETIGDVDTLILGGYDRGIEYGSLRRYLEHTGVRNLFFTGGAGKRLMQELEDDFPGKYHKKWFDDFDSMIAGAIAATAPGRSCLLSPAAASYDRFMNFEHRGNRFRELVYKSYSRST